MAPLNWQKAMMLNEIILQQVRRDRTAGGVRGSVKSIKQKNTKRKNPPCEVVVCFFKRKISFAVQQRPTPKMGVEF